MHARHEGTYGALPLPLSDDLTSTPVLNRQTSGGSTNTSEIHRRRDDEEFGARPLAIRFLPLRVGGPLPLRHAHFSFPHCFPRCWLLGE